MARCNSSGTSTFRLILGVIVAVTVRSLISTSPTAKIDTEISPPRYSQNSLNPGAELVWQTRRERCVLVALLSPESRGMSILPICNLSASSRGEATEKWGFRRLLRSVKCSKSQISLVFSVEYQNPQQRPEGLVFHRHLWKTVENLWKPLWEARKNLKKILKPKIFFNLLHCFFQPLP